MKTKTCDDCGCDRDDCVTLGESRDCDIGFNVCLACLEACYEEMLSEARYIPVPEALEPPWADEGEHPY